MTICRPCPRPQPVTAARYIWAYDFVLDAGANVNSIGGLGNTPLHQAIMIGQLESARLLLQHGATKQTRNEFGEAPLDVAKLSGIEEMIRLLEAGR